MFIIGFYFRLFELFNILNFWVWIFGMVEWEINIFFIYFVLDMLEDIVVLIIERYVEVWFIIYNGGLSVYCGLNELGYNYFIVLYKYFFKKVYIN